MSDGLTPDDVREILRIVDDSGLEELDLETSRFTIRFRRGTENERPEPTVPTAGLVDVIAPTVGTFYRAPAPGQPPFVEIGAAVEAETVVCILEVMKLMSSVPAGAPGTVAEICVDNGMPVQYGDVLFRLKPR